LAGALEPRESSLRTGSVAMSLRVVVLSRVVVVQFLVHVIVVVAWANVSVPSSQRGGTVLTLSSSWRGGSVEPLRDDNDNDRGCVPASSSLRRGRGLCAHHRARGTMWAWLPLGAVLAAWSSSRGGPCVGVVSTGGRRRRKRTRRRRRAPGARCRMKSKQDA